MEGMAHRQQNEIRKRLDGVIALDDGEGLEPKVLLDGLEVQAWKEMVVIVQKRDQRVEKTENLRLYCKGLVSEEMVRDVKSVVAGVGVAICDPMDNLIFETRKNLEAVVNGIVLSNEAAELEAIIEGLNNALTLDLEAVTFFCDDYMIYHYNYLHSGDAVILLHVHPTSVLYDAD
ncbi:hypothetical protein TB2_018574 [Malus domestica]